MSVLRIGIFGTGNIAGAHVRALLKLPDVQIVGLCNHKLAKAEAFNEKYLSSSAKCYTDFDRMLGETPMDAVYACVPPGAHGGEVETAAAKGIHLMLEKPIALTIARAESIVAAVTKASVKCQMGHNFRHTAPAIRLKQYLTDGTAGRPLFMQGNWLCNSLNGAWWRDPLMGGGHLIEQSIHIYDLARYFLGDADIVTGFVDKLAHERFPDYRVDDNSAATIRFRNGAIGSICGSNAADPWSWLVSARVVCEKMFVEFKTMEHASFVFHHGMPSQEAWKDGVEHKVEEIKGPDNGLPELNRNFIAALRDEEPPRSSVDDGLKDLRLVLGVAQSSANDGSPQPG